VLKGGGKRRGVRGGNGSVRGEVSAITSQERQEAMRNQSLKGSTRCIGPPARRAAGSCARGAGTASCQEQRAVVRRQGERRQ
jgi:hypothetical protein